MSALDHLDRLAGGAVERAFGETLRYVPRVQPRNAAPSLDPSHPVFELPGVFSLAPVTITVTPGRRAGTATLGQTELATYDAALALTAAVVAAMSEPPKQGDAVELVGRAGTPRYRVADVQIDDLGSALLLLSREF